VIHHYARRKNGTRKWQIERGCNCCSCCCLLISTIKELRNNTVSNLTPSQFHPVHMADKCIKCGACITACPLDAVSIDNGKITFDENVCIGCGICSKHCNQKAIQMVRREVQFDIPKSYHERNMRIAKDKGREY
jgi:2-oxoacid:acceptor oxidoreductase delta subunit (pyruvate/2-ketoisovalerate family)